MANLEETDLENVGSVMYHPESVNLDATASGEKFTPRRHKTPEEFHAEYGYYLADETKAQKFNRVAARRASVVIDVLRQLPALGNKSLYECTDEHAAKLFDTIYEEFKKAADAFEGARKGVASPRSKSFTF